MAHNFNGDATGITPATAIQVTIPDDGDPDNVASVNPTAFQKVTNWVKFLFSFVAFMGGAGGGGSYNNVGPAGGTALRLTGGAGNSTALLATGSGTGPGVLGLAAAGSAGVGVQGTTDGTNAGVRGTTSGAGAAGDFSSSAGGSAVKATAIDANHLAMEIPEGAIQLNGATRAPNLSANNLLTPGLLIKAWALVNADGAGGVTVLDGQNIGGVALVTTFTGKKGVQVTWAQNFSTAAYATFALGDGGIVGGTSNYAQVAQFSKTGVHATFYMYDPTSAGAPVFDLATVAGQFMVVALGQQ